MKALVSETPPSLEKIIILIVDDEPGFLELSKIYLEEEDKRLNIDTAFSAADALKKLVEKH